MDRLGFPRWLAVAALLGSLLVAAADAQPRVQVAALTMDAGTLTGYLTIHAVARSGPSTPGIHLQSGTGFCFGPSAQQRSMAYACFWTALTESGVDKIFDGARPYTVFAPTDAAFAHLVQTVGPGPFRRLMSSRAALAALVRESIVPGSRPLGTLAFGAAAGGESVTLPTLSGQTLLIEIGPGAGNLSAKRAVAVGPATGVDGQAYVSDVSTRFRDGSVLIPLSRVPLVDAAMP